MIALVLCSSGCAEQTSTDSAAPGTGPAVENAGIETARIEAAGIEAAGTEAAQSTLRGFFAVKGRAEDPIGVRIDQQSVFLTSRDVHPSAASEAGMGDRPSGITDSAVSVELSDARWVGGEIRIDFAFDSTGVSYPTIGDEVELDQGTQQASHWDGTATLQNRNGDWLIDQLSIDSYGCGVS